MLCIIRYAHGQCLKLCVGLEIHCLGLYKNAQLKYHLEFKSVCEQVMEYTSIGTCLTIPPVFYGEDRLIVEQKICTDIVTILYVGWEMVLYLQRNENSSFW